MTGIRGDVERESPSGRGHPDRSLRAGALADAAIHGGFSSLRSALVPFDSRTNGHRFHNLAGVKFIIGFMEVAGVEPKAAIKPCVSACSFL
jgi:hypothetical protein